ncbi:MAG: DoxX family protein [Candidatus Jorgensenbacteria bacterium]|nr:DoxX family protein [Candidatus Jorgensenbacteria bacterium]
MIQPLFVFYDWALLALRIVLGVILIAHGYPKLRNLKGTADWMGSVGLRPGIAFAVASVVIEFFGGLALIAGFATQIVALAVLVQFVVIILKVNRAKGLKGGYEFDLLIAASALLLATTGSGLFGLDSTLGIFIY